MQRVEIARARRDHELSWHGGRRVLAVPSARPSLAVQIISQWLLVEARLRAAGKIAIRRPEPGAIRREHLVDQGDRATRVAAELELGIRDDDSLVAGDRGTEGIDLKAETLQLRGDRFTEGRCHFAPRDVLVGS